ncbi:adenine-specific DNA-methyltransferase [Lachnospiraceae bacterium PFB1-21]
MNRLTMHTNSKAERNYAALTGLFPNAVTEAIDENGDVVRAIDKDVLMQEINTKVVDGNEERYQFTWPDKKKAVLLANAPIAKTLCPCREESVDFDDTQNLYIEGDNLEVLKLLQETYLGKVKMIYIDPPYNTGNDFVYEDDFAQSTEKYLENSGQFDDDGNRLIKNLDSNGRFHTDWLNMIYPRLRIARDLLAEDGVIFISIDDNEQENLVKICNEIFGEVNHQATISYVRKTSGKQDSTNFMKSTEFILVYSKSLEWDCSPIIATERVTDRYNKTDENGRLFRETDLRKTGNADRREDRPLMWYPFYYNPSTDDLIVRQQEDTELIQNGYVEIYPIKPDQSEGRWRWGYQTACDGLNNLVARIMPKYKSEKKYTIYEMDFIDKNGNVRTVKEHTSWDRKEFNSDNAMLEFKKLGFSNQLFPFPKSSALLKHMVYLSNASDSIILDFFSGSATTAHAVMQLNAEDGGNRKFIMVQIPEETDEKSEAYKAGYKNICEIGKERIRRAGKKIMEENKDKEGIESLDRGFRVLKLDSTNMKDVYYNPADYEADLFSTMTDNIKEDRTSEDLLFQVMLDLGVLLSSKIEESSIASKKVFDVADGFLIACFDEDVTEETITAIAQKKPYYFVMRDSSMANDSVATNFEQIFATYSPDTVRKVL